MTPNSIDPKLLRAIDRIGARKASRFEWEVVSDLPWSDLSPFLKPAGGLAHDAPDPDEPEERLAVWRCEDGAALLESAEIPAHRPHVKVGRDALVLHRLDVASLASVLSEHLGFVAHRPKGAPPLLTIGFVQNAGKRQAEVALFLPVADPYANALALGRLDPQQRMIVWTPTARWKRCAPAGTEVRDLESAMVGAGKDHLVNVLAEMRETREGERTGAAIIHVKPGDRWEDVKISLSLETLLMRATIGQRKGKVTLRDRSGNPTNAATILGRVLAEQPPRWSNSFFPKKKGTDYRKAFQRFTGNLQAWIPINDGHPFREDPSTHEHHARFQCEKLIRRIRRSDPQNE
jgi:hypothetical protein